MKRLRKLLLLNVIGIVLIIYNTIPDYRTNRNTFPHLQSTTPFRDSTDKGGFPDVIVIGVEGCGNTVMMNFLNATGYFQVPNRTTYSSDFFTGNWERGEEWYRSLFTQENGQRITIENSPHYFYAYPPTIPQKMLTLNPNMKVILQLCDPIQRAFSCYVHNHKHYTPNIAGAFAEYARVHLLQLQGELNTKIDFHHQERHVLSKWNSRNRCIQAGLYVYHLERWQKSFNHSRMLILDGDDMIREPWTSYAKIQDFLEMPKLIHKEDWVLNNKTGQYCLKPSSRIPKPPLCVQPKSTDIQQPKEEIISAFTTFYKPYNEELFKILGYRYPWQ
uniref:Sulfotransferase n=1 Tax=Phallusia mammillata TaxID=59560 RepID=A0A6F9DEY9_9ASCI|nr:heparan sulfate glucosamine 3-O-sulfotransferase 4-like [Phallusia mammillata]